MLATLLALPAVYAGSQTRSERLRAILFGVGMLPLLSPACVYGYSWMLAGSQRGWMGHALGFAGFNEDGAGPARAVVALATWLWPVPAMLLAASYRHAGRAAYRMARLDAGAAVAFFRGALPAMSGAAVAGFAIVFVLALNESTICPLVLTRTWPAEMAPEVLDSAMYGSPAAALAWKSWPVIGIVMLAAALGWPGLRRVWEAVEQDGGVELGGRLLSSAGGMAAAVLLTALIALAPIWIFVNELYVARVSIGATMARVWTLYGAEWRASSIVSAMGCAAGALIAWAGCRFELGASRRVAFAGRSVLFGCGLVAALLPAELMAQLLVQMFNRRGLLGRLYDDTPVVWVLGIVSRYGFFAALIGWFASRRVPIEITRQARIDGAGDSGAALTAARPWVGRPIAGAGVLLGCLSLSEVAASLVLIPPRFGGSLAVALDNQMHYGRNQDLVVSTLMVLVPLLFVSISAAVVLNGAWRAENRG